MLKNNFSIDSEQFLFLGTGTVIRLSCFEALISEGNRYLLFLKGRDKGITITNKEAEGICKLLKGFVV